MAQQQLKGLLLNGGCSSRMGSDKASLSLGSCSLKEHMVMLLHSAGIEDVVVSGQQVKDRYEGQGPLAGIEAVLTAFPSAQWLVVPIDMPQLTVSALQQLIHHGQLHHTCVHFDTSVMPLYVHQGDSCLVKARACLTSSNHRNWSIRNWLTQLDCHTLADPNDASLSNINTPQQWQCYLNSLTTNKT
ncbi:molybdenum cofactor guanylyltransferase [Neiella marina]|uniref:Molybdenum cofactor guanylyltransferase n=1 Tax=Neiella holothuriorum TaxID=2870530 RepID=A0ABS7EGS8_9GAMM|nr:molybdenum cofactor guanylyltransferase [Neiella holothuriorum]MBW8191530.1 molybdenum cofactor guanylyltransferase [Neiella holothuriorum]